MRVIISWLAAVAGIVAGLFGWLLFRRRVLVLCYHTISKDLPGEMSPEIFERQIQSLLDRGYRFISICEYADWLEGKIRLSRKAALLTFDDGFRSQLNAIPFMKKNGIAAINFIAPERIGGIYDWDGVPERLREPLMTEQEIRQWLDAGFQIGSHTLGHVHLDRLPAAEKLRQIEASRTDLRNRFAVECDWLCYPYGDFDFQCEVMAQASGYRGAFACYKNTHPWRLERYALRRLLAYPGWSGKKYLYKTSWRYELVSFINLSLKRLPGSKRSQDARRTSQGREL